MATKLESADDFASTLAEVEMLLRESEESAPGKDREDELRVAVMNKAALLLLTGKFEAFLESAADDFLSAVNKVGSKARFIPPRLFAEHSVLAVQAIDQKLNNGDIDGVRVIFSNLGRLWSELEPCTELKVSSEFNYGKHGESEIIRLFKRFGLDDVFANIRVVDDAEDIFEGQPPSLVDIRGVVNSLTGIRNNILHQDSTPTLTVDRLRKEAKSLTRFATELVKTLQSIVDEVERQSQATPGVPFG